MTIDREKQVAAEAAAELVEDGMVVGLGTGRPSPTAAGARPRGRSIDCVATSPATEQIALDLGITVHPFAGPMAPRRLDIAIDGADQVDPAGWMIKGGGGPTPARRPWRLRPTGSS